MKTNEKMMLIAIVALGIAPCLGFANQITESGSGHGALSNMIDDSGVRNIITSYHGAGNSIAAEGGNTGGFVDYTLSKI